MATLAIFYGALKVAAFVASPLLAVGVVLGIFITGTLLVGWISRKIVRSIIGFEPPKDTTGWTVAAKELYFNHYRYLPEIAAQAFENEGLIEDFIDDHATQKDIDWTDADAILRVYKEFDSAPTPGIESDDDES